VSIGGSIEFHLSLIESHFQQNFPHFLNNHRQITPASQLQSQTPQGFWAVARYCIIMPTAIGRLSLLPLLSLLSNRHWAATAVGIIMLYFIIIYY
jgi:hypothetical protein